MLNMRARRSAGRNRETTSSGFAASLGRLDQETTFDELCAHTEALVGALGIPLSVDGERLFAQSGSEAASAVATLAEAGASGVSIEDYDPATGAIDELAAATELVGAASEAAASAGMVLTARAENHLYGIDDLDDTIDRLLAYRDAGAGVLYAPGITSPADVERVVVSVGAPVNVLLKTDAPGPSELAALGVRRASTGGALARTAYGAAEAQARELLTSMR